ncbi:unnamed protein product [Amoebophrya sp. A25]|nr:unnamed protein product [Amoebophrya sp. A25]|eukprot:GSA25T00027730001.1
MRQTYLEQDERAESHPRHGGVGQHGPVPHSESDEEEICPFLLDEQQAHETTTPLVLLLQQKNVKVLQLIEYYSNMQRKLRVVVRAMKERSHNELGLVVPKILSPAAERKLTLDNMVVRILQLLRMTL